MATTRRRMGDRKDGRLLRSLPAYNKFIPYIMPERVDRLVHYEESVEISAVDRMLRKLRIEGYKGIGLLHFLIACHIRTVSMLPGLNRYIVGRRIYAHNDITVVMTVKQSLSIDATETTIKVHFQPTDTIFDVFRKMNEKIEEVKTAEGDNNTEEAAAAFAKLPRPILRLAIAALRVMDYYDWIPNSLLEASPFHGSFIVTDLGSLRMGPVYHHIYNFGTLPMFLAFGAKYKKYEITRKRELVENKYIDCKMVLDEGIVDGHYYSQLLRSYHYIFSHPEILLSPPSRVNEDIF